MKTVWTEYYDDIKPIECAWCDGKDHEIYQYEGEAVCEWCLKNEPVDEPETGLTLAERNA